MALFAALALGGCARDIPHTYKVEGGGRVYFDPERGVVREGFDGASANDDEQIRRTRSAFSTRSYQTAIALAYDLRLRDPDGPHAYEAIIIEAISLAEQGRSAHPGWLLNDLANAVIDQESASTARLPDGLLSSDLDARVRGIGRETSKNGSLEASWERTREILLYYSAAFGIVQAESLHDMVQRHARNLAWYAFMGSDYRLAEEISSHVVERTARTDIRSTAELILADTAYAIGWYERSETHYRSVAASSRNPDLQEEARLKEIKSILGQSKGPEYDRRPYVTALAKIGEYKSDYLTQRPDARRKEEFYRLEMDVKQVLIAQEREAANAYSRVFEPEASAYFTARAIKAQREANESAAKSGLSQSGGTLIPKGQ